MKVCRGAWLSNGKIFANTYGSVGVFDEGGGGCQLKTNGRKNLRVTVNMPLQHMVSTGCWSGMDSGQKRLM